MIVDAGRKETSMPDEAPTFEAYIASERARIAKERDKVVAKKADLEQQLSTLDRELMAITAYEDAKAGRTTARTATPRAASSGGGTRRTGQRDAVLSLIKSHTDGITPSQILVQMNATSDAEKTSVRNALSALKRTNAVGTRDGKYFPA
jgi:hypothetical protein